MQPPPQAAIQAVIVERPDIKLALEAARDESDAISGRIFPVTLGQQGDRVIVNATWTMGSLKKLVRADPAAKGGATHGATNRPFMPDKAKALKRYLIDNRSCYTLPPLTLALDRFPKIFTVQSNMGGSRQGYMVLNDDVVNFLTEDGQHRLGVIVGAPAFKLVGLVDEDPTWLNDAIGVQIVLESSITQIHQDFADAAKTTPIPASLLAAYDTRNIANRVLQQIVQRSTLLRDRVDETSKTMPKYSQRMFLLNQVRMFIKELLVGDSAVSDPAFTAAADERLADAADETAFIDQAVLVLDTLASHMKPWNEVAAQPSRVPELRTVWLNMAATGLVVIGRVVHHINTTYAHASEAERVTKYGELASHIDWRRAAPIWQGNVITANKVATQRAPVRLAADAVIAALGLPAVASLTSAPAPAAVPVAAAAAPPAPVLAATP